MIENFANGSLFDDASGIHDGDIVAHVRNDAKIVSDEQKREFEFLPQCSQQIQILQLNGRVERRRCLIGNQHLWAAGDRNGPAHALAHTAAELMRIRLHPSFRRRHPDTAQTLDDTLQLRAFAKAFMQCDGLADLIADAEYRI